MEGVGGGVFVRAGVSVSGGSGGGGRVETLARAQSELPIPRTL